MRNLWIFIVIMASASCAIVDDRKPVCLYDSRMFNDGEIIRVQFKDESEVVMECLLEIDKYGKKQAYWDESNSDKYDYSFRF